MNFKLALCDLGANISLMPLLICHKLDMGEMQLTIVSLQLAYRSIKCPICLLEKFFILADFVMLQMEEDSQIPIILSEPLLATAGVLIDIKRGTLSLIVGDGKMMNA